MSQRKEKSNKIESIPYPTSSTSSSHPEITSTSHSQYNNQVKSDQELINSTPRSFISNNPSSTSDPYHPHFSSLDPQSSSANLSSQVLLRPSNHQNSHNYTHLSASQVEMMQSQQESDSIDPQSSSLTAQQPARVLQVASPDNQDDSLEDRGTEVEQRSSSSQPSSLEEDGERVSRDGWSSNDHTEVHTPSSRTSREPTLASPAGGLEKEGIQFQGMEEISLADDPVGIQDMTISQDQTATNFIPPINPQANPSVTPISPSRPPPTSSNWLSRSASKMSIGGGGGSNSRNRSSSVGSSNQSPNRSRPHTSSGSTSTNNSSSPFGFNRPRAGTWRKLPGAMSSALNLNNLSKEDLQESNPGSSTPSAMRTPKTSMYATIASPPPAPTFASTSKQKSTEPPPLIPSSPNTDKRRLFARAPISRDSSSGSFKAPSTNQEEDSNQRSGGARGFVKRMGSRTFFRGGKNSSETQLESSKFTQQSGESTDTLSSATESTTGQSVSSSTTRSAKRLSSDAAVGVGRTSSLTAWAKRRSSKASIRSSINEPPSPRLRTSGHSLENSENSNRLSQSSHPRSSIDSSQSSVQSRETTDLDPGSAAASSEALPSASNGEGVPKRLSSWLFNVLGTDNQASSNTVSSPTALEDSNQDPSSSSRSRSQNNSSQNGSGSGLSSNLGSSSGGGLPAASRSKTSLLSSISASARARALGYAGAGQQQQGAGTSSNGAGSSVGSGLDKALRYFLDSDSNSQNQAEEGIWLLGVWHGASTTNPNSASASNTSPPIGSSPYGQGPSIEVQTASPEVPVRRSKRSNTLPSSPSTSRSGASKQGSLEQVEEGIISPQRKDSSSITETPRTPSPHTPTSSDTDVHIVARNPPTPHTSPQPSKVSSKQPLIQSQPNSSSSNLPSSSAPTSSSGVGWQSTFQPDFSSRIWCTYRNHFAPIARDGTISDQAERAAADSARAAALVESNSSSPSTPALNIPQTPSSTSSIQSNMNSGGRLWLGRRNNDNSSTSDLLSTSNQVGASHSPTSRFTPGGLGAALGIGSAGSNSISSSPSSSNFNPSAPTASSSSSGLAAGLSEKMGIPGLWGRATAAAQAAGLGGRQGLTTDAGWGCMLRTGQSLLANALLNVHLGRTWSKEELSLLQNLSSASDDSADPSSISSQMKGAKSRYATYVKLLSWFLDDPSSACPFSVHRMAREGKRLGKEVGEWFGPSTAAGAIKKLVDDYPQAGIGVSLATDGVVYRSHVRAAAVVDSERSWERPVLVLIGVRLGLEGVNPMYYDSVKDTFSFPQSVGIAGGRPSSSYYFMGFQGSSLFYLDPHHSRSAVPFRHPPPQFMEASNSPEEAEESDEWWCQAYSEAQLSTFHCDRIRRMPIKGLDPSMLLGFLCMDEASLDDLTSKVRSLNKPIFSIADAPPRWMGLEMGISKEGEEESQDLEDDLAIESFSESNGSESEDEGRNEDSVEDDSEDWIQEGNPQEEEEEDISGRETETVSGSTELEPPLKSTKESNKSLKKQLSSTSESNSIRFPVSNDSPNRPSSLSASNQSGSRHPSGTSESTFTQHHSNRNLTPLTTSNPSTSSYLGDESFSSIGSSDGEASPSWTQVSPDGRDSRPSVSNVAESSIPRSSRADRSASEEMEGSDKDDF